MSVLICGSLAYDHIMLFKDQFKNHILPEKVHILNVSFLAPEMRREFGGCAGNIAYNLNLLEAGIALPMATAGKDFEPYAGWLDRHNIHRGHIRVLEEAFTAQAFITTDLDDNQITAFHPGAMSESHQNDVHAASGIELGIISPDGKQGMLRHAAQFAEAGIPFIFDPGQGLPLFDGPELAQFIDRAAWVAVNDYEWQLLRERTGLTAQNITERARALIVTRGKEGSTIYTRDKARAIPAARPAAVRDPTGCGDAYRAGLLYGLRHAMDWETTGRIASLMGAIKIEQNGTQNHRFGVDEFKARFAAEFGYSF